MKKVMLCVFLLIISLVFVGFFSGNAEAIPTFARKYKTSCSTCHTAIPQRNAFGDAFRRLGFRMPGGDKAFVKEEPVALGAEAWKEVWPEAIWPGLLPATVPISFYGHQRVVWKEDASSSEGATYFDAPHELEMLFGGNWGERISFFAEWILYEKSFANDKDKLGAMYIQFNDLLGSTPGMLNFKIGRFETGAARGLKDDNRLTPSHAMSFDYTVAGGGADKSLRTKQSGVEFNGILGSRFEYAFGAVNGGGDNTDSNDAKDLFYRVGFKLGGMGLDGSGGIPKGELVQKDNWRDDSITLGTFGYFGYPSANNATTEENYTRFGADLRLSYSRLAIEGAVVFGNDEVAAGKDIKSTAFNVDLQYLFFPWLIANVRYEQKSFDDNTSNKDVEAVVANLTVLQRANIRWNLEYYTYLEDKDGNDTAKLNIMFAF